MTTRAEDLSQFGSALDDFPKGLMAKQVKVFLSELRHRYGTIRLLRMVVPVLRERRRLQKTHVAVMKTMKQDWGRGAVNEALIMSACFGMDQFTGWAGAVYLGSVSPVGTQQGLARRSSTRSLMSHAPPGGPGRVGLYPRQTATNPQHFKFQFVGFVRRTGMYRDVANSS